MGSRTYATLDPNQLSAAGELELSGLVVTADSSAALGQSRSTLALSTGSWYVESLFYGEGDLGSNCRIGIGTSAAVLSNVIGSDIASYAYRLDTGQVYNNGAVVATFSGASKGDIVSLAVGLDESTPSLYFYINGAGIGSVAIEPADYYIFAAVQSSVAYEMRAFVNFGQRLPEKSTPTGFTAGWYTEAADPDTLRIASQSYTTTNSDDPANTFYDGRFPESFSLATTRSITVWPWGRSGGSRAGVTGLQIIDPDRSFDVLLSDDYRDQNVTIRLLDEGDSFADAVVVASAIFDGVSGDDNGKSIRLRDKLSKMDTPLQRRLFLPNAADSAANQPIPVILGTARNVDPVLYDEFNLAYAVHDDRVNSIVVVRDKADPLDPTGSPEDWSYNETSSGFLLNVAPQGKLTADVSTTGGISSTVVDMLGGDGNPFTFAGSPGELQNWTTNSGTNSGEPYGTTDSELIYALMFTGPSGPAAVSPYMLAGVTLVPGSTYRLRVTIGSISYHGGARGSSLRVGHSASSDELGWITSAGEFTLTFVAAGTDLYLTAQQDAAGGDGLRRELRVDSVTLEDVTATIVTDFDATIAGITLAEYAQEVIENRAGFTAADWDVDSAIAVDVGAYDCGIYARNPITCRQALDAIIDSYTGFWFQDRRGVIKFGRLFAPGGPDDSPTPDADWTFTAGDILSDVTVELDTAKGLSNSIACRRNWSVFGDSDFVTDTVDVPLALRAKLSREYQFTRVSAVNLAECYQHALVAAPIPSLIDDPEDAQIEIDRVCSIYSVKRYFYTFTVAMTSRNEFTMEPGQTVHLTYDAATLDSGKRLMVAEVEADAFRGTVRVRAWG